MDTEVFTDVQDEEGVSVLSHALSLTSKQILNFAKSASVRRGSANIRENDIKDAIREFKALQPKTPRFYRIPVAGKGACLFISARLVLEMGHLNNQIDAGTPSECFLLDGKHEAMEAAGQSLRGKCVEWFRRRISSPIPQLGHYIQNGRQYVRGDLPALEMVRNGKDIPEDGPERLNAILEYLAEMAMPYTWGSSPEYTAVAMMTGKIVNIWQRNGRNLVLIDSVNGKIPSADSADLETTELTDEESHESDESVCKFNNDAENDAIIYDGLEEIDMTEEVEENDDGSEYSSSYNLYFVGGCHYEALITREHYLKLISTYGIDAVANILPLNE
jgi:hypothetical protein